MLVRQDEGGVSRETPPFLLLRASDSLSLSFPWLQTLDASRGASAEASAGGLRRGLRAPFGRVDQL